MEAWRDLIRDKMSGRMIPSYATGFKIWSRKSEICFWQDNFFFISFTNNLFPSKNYIYNPYGMSTETVKTKHTTVFNQSRSSVSYINTKYSVWRRLQINRTDSLMMTCESVPSWLSQWLTISFFFFLSFFIQAATRGPTAHYAVLGQKSISEWLRFWLSLIQSVMVNLFQGKDIIGIRRDTR